MTGFAAAISLGAGVAGPLLPGAPLFLFQQALVFVSLLFIPISIGVAILRSHLWDIDIIVNRALVYSLLTACIVGLYVFVVGYLGTLFHSELNLLISLAAAGLVAVIFEPLRRILQRGANRLFYGLRDEPYMVLASLSQTLKASLDPEAVLPTIVESVRQALKLSYAAIELDLGEGPVLAAVSGAPGTGQPLRLPLIYQGRPTGALLVESRGKGDALNPADLRLLENLSGQVSVAAHAVRLSIDLHRMAADLQHSRETLIVAREEERRRLRRDLHDGVGPTLASLAQRIDTASRLVKSDPDTAVAMLETLKGQVKTTIAEIRRLVYALRPPVLDELGLVSAIQQQALLLQEGAGLRITVEAPTQLPELPAAVEVAAYRIIMEALTNVQRHAQAQNCLVRLGMEGGNALCLTVWDDGRGLPAGHQAGVGISSMRERAAELGGIFELTSRAGEGTSVQVRLPVTEQNSA
jgi:signal transduction histidine kinase